MEWIRQLLAVSAVFLLLAGTVWWLRRNGFGARAASLGLRRNSRRLEHVERLALGPQHSLHLVRVEDDEILVAQSPSGLAILLSQGSLRGAAGEADLPGEDAAL